MSTHAMWSTPMAKVTGSGVDDPETRTSPAALRDGKVAPSAVPLPSRPPATPRADRPTASRTGPVGRAAAPSWTSPPPPQVRQGAAGTAVANARRRRWAGSTRATGHLVGGQVMMTHRASDHRLAAAPAKRPHDSPGAGAVECRRAVSTWATRTRASCVAAGRLRGAGDRWSGTPQASFAVPAREESCWSATATAVCAGGDLSVRTSVRASVRAGGSCGGTSGRAEIGRACGARPARNRP